MIQRCRGTFFTNESFKYFIVSLRPIFLLSIKVEEIFVEFFLGLLFYKPSSVINVHMSDPMTITIFIFGIKLRDLLMMMFTHKELLCGSFSHFY